MYQYISIIIEMLTTSCQRSSSHPFLTFWTNIFTFIHDNASTFGQSCFLSLRSRLYLPFKKQKVSIFLWILFFLFTNCSSICISFESIHLDLNIHLCTTIHQLGWRNKIFIFSFSFYQLAISDIYVFGLHFFCINPN